MSSISCSGRRIAMALRCLRHIGGLSSQLRCSGSIVGTAGPFDRFDDALSLRGLGTSSAMRFPDIVVPPMGDSISEGTVAALLKKAGDSVAVDETIAQVETDKVTIDIRSTAAGTIKSLMVKANDVVTPGQVIASVTEGAPASAPKPAAAAADTGAAQASNKPAPTPAAPPASSSSGSGDADAHPPHRHIGIHFPPRRTENGERISDMPAKAALDYLAKHAGGDGHATAAPPGGDGAASASAPPAAAATPAAAAATDKLQPAPPRSQAMGHMPKAPSLLRREISERELEAINLGGAF